MRKIDLGSITDCEVIFSHDDTVILSGKNPWIFHKDGTFVAKHKTIRNAYKMVFLPENMVLMDGAVDRAYHYVSLDSGKLEWSISKMGRRSMTPNQFAVTPDGNTIYYIYKIDNVLYVDRIIPHKQACETFKIPLDICATYHCYCDSEGMLSLLQSFYVKDIMADGTDNSYYFNGVLKWTPENDRPVWKYQWRTKPGSAYTPCICNDEYILFDNFVAASFKTGRRFNLLECNPQIKRAPGRFLISAYDPVRQLLTVRFSSSASTVIIDCKKRKIVAHYAPITPGLSGGCLIGNEFWIGTNKGVIKRPFPNMDEFPQKF